MLIAPIYINEKLLDGFMAQIEGGSLQTRSETANKIKGGGIKAGVKIAGVDGEVRTSSETQSEYSEHIVGKLDRFIKALKKNRKEYGWINATEKACDFLKLERGNLITMTCEFTQPDFFRVISQGTQLGELLELGQAFAGLDIGFQAEVSELNNARKVVEFIENIKSEPLLIGESDSLDWKIVGNLQANSRGGRVELEAEYDVIAKVRKLIPEGKEYLMLDFPGFGMLNRDQRRKLESNMKKDPNQEQFFIQGPLALVDLIAIYN